MASKEDNYKSQLEALGVYSPAFDPAIHDLCILERELSRVRKAWRATEPDKSKTPSFTDPLYAVILQLDRTIQASRDALGLTPKGLQRLKGKQPAELPEKQKADINSKLDALMERVNEYG